MNEEPRVKEALIKSIMNRPHHHNHHTINIHNLGGTVMRSKFSTIYTATLTIHHHHQEKQLVEEERVELVVKMSETDPTTQQMAHHSQMFNKEIKVYEEVIPAMEELCRRRGQTWMGYEEKEGSEGWRPWPKYYGSCDGEIILLEDLTKRGYTTRDTTMDLHHAITALTALARFHGLSALLESEGGLDPGLWKPVREQGTSHRVLSKLFEDFILGLGQHVLQRWHPKWKGLGEQLIGAAKLWWDGMVGAKIKTGTDEDEVIPQVLNHGDPWMNNFMFAHSQNNGQITAVKLVDWQLCFYGSCVLDLIYLCVTSLSRQLEEDETLMDQLIKHYCRKLEETTEGRFTLKRKQLNKYLVKTSIYRLLIGIATVPFMWRKARDVDVDVKECHHDVEQSAGVNTEIESPSQLFNCPFVKERLEYIMEPFIHQDIITQIQALL